MQKQTEKQTVSGSLQSKQKVGEQMDLDVLHCCEAPKEMKLSRRFSKRASYNITVSGFSLHLKILIAFEDFPVYHVTRYNRDLKYQYNTNRILNVIYFRSTTQGTLNNFD